MTIIESLSSIDGCIGVADRGDGTYRIDLSDGSSRDATESEIRNAANRIKWSGQAAQRAQIQARRVLNAPLPDNPSKTDIEARIQALRTLQGV